MTFPRATGKTNIPRLRLGMSHCLGRLANLAGMGVVREGAYISPSLGVQVRVRVSSLYTTITVNGVDVYFDRLSGSIDGVGGDASVFERGQK